MTLDDRIKMCLGDLLLSQLVLTTQLEQAQAEAKAIKEAFDKLARETQSTALGS